MTQLLHRLGYVYKKPGLIPGKASVERQKDFVERYQTIKADRATDDPVCFMGWSENSNIFRPNGNSDSAPMSIVKSLVNSAVSRYSHLQPA